MILNDFFASDGRGLGTALQMAIPDDVAIVFELRGPGGGTWTVRREGEGVSVAPSVIEPTDCRVACSVDDFGRLVRGELRGRQGFLDGRIGVEGDVGLVMRLLNAALQR